MSSVATRARLLATPLAHGPYRLIWTSQLVSELGDWAARIAVTALIYARTGSATLSALTYVLGLLPWVGPGQWLATLADRYGRRIVMVSSDLARAAIFVTLCLPLPAWAVLLLVGLAGLAAPPFEAARAAATPEVVPRSTLPGAVTLAQLTQDVSVIAGSLVGGLLLALIGPVPALGVNAATFLVSAVLLLRLPRLRPQRVAGVSGGQLIRAGAKALLDDPLVRAAAIVAAVSAGAATAAESLVVAHVAQTQPGLPWLAGAILAAVSALTILGTLLAPSDADARTLLRVTVILTTVGAAGTLLLLLAPGGVTASVGFVALGALFVPLVTGNVLVSPRLPAASRASAFALLMGGLAAMQGVLAPVAGLVADRTSPATGAATVLVLPMLVGAAFWLRLPHLHDRSAGTEDGGVSPARVAGPPRPIGGSGDSFG